MSSSMKEVSEKSMPNKLSTGDGGNGDGEANEEKDEEANEENDEEGDSLATRDELREPDAVAVAEG